MTIEERFERIEHVTAGFAEERRKDREEHRQLWRDTQRQLNEIGLRVNDLTVKIADTNDTISRLADESQKNLNRLADESRAADKRLEERIEGLVSAIGKFLAGQSGR